LTTSSTTGRSDCAAARQAYLRLTESGEQRPEREHTRTHRFYEVVRRFEKLDVVSRDLMRPKLRRQNRSTKVFEQASLSDQIFNIRNVMQRDRFRRQKRRGEAWQRRILRAADLDLSIERPSASN